MPKAKPKIDHNESQPAGERLQRVLASRGVASRRASEELITAGRISVNGKVITELGTRVDSVQDEIRVDGRILQRQRPRFIILNKPSGFITTVKDERQRWTVMDLVEVPERVYPVGRLDRETQGLLLLTNDGAVANRVTHPRYGLTKEYHVITDKRPTDMQLLKLNDGIWVNGRLVEPDECRLMRTTREGIIIKIVLHEGLYHVVRNMMETVGINVLKLRRVRLGPLMMQGIPPGSWRDLTPGELGQLFEAVGLPAGDAEKLNARRPLQLQPVGGFVHSGGEEESAPAPFRPNRESRPASGRPQTTRRSGSPHESARSSSSHRDRRSRGGR
ncbi:MAG: rRNA pseudouridine synthase [Chloroflexota bacterium]|nr:rRNA pseudouridine synthase [Chloroflexota bacterium]